METGNKLERLSAMGLLIWGIWLLLPWDTFGASPSFRAMKAFAPEWIWGASIAFVGFLQTLATLRKNYRARIVTAMLAIFFWLAIVIFFFLGNILSTAWIPYIVLAIMNIVALVELNNANNINEMEKKLCNLQQNSS
jgi:CHASE2 domain-containing sensor protein